MCEKDVLRVRRAVSMVVAAKAKEGLGDKEEAMRGLVAAIAKELGQGHKLNDIETILKGGRQ